MNHDTRISKTEKKTRKTTLSKMTGLQRPQSNSRMLPSIKDNRRNESTVSMKDNETSMLRATSRLKDSITTLATSRRFGTTRNVGETGENLNSTSTYLDYRIKELERLKEKEFKYFANNYVEILDKRIEELKADIEYEKNRSKALTTRNPSLSVNKRSVIERDSEEENKESKIIVSEIYYSRKKLDTLLGRNNDLKSRLQSLNFKEQMKARRPSKFEKEEKVEEKVSVAPSKDNLKAKKLSANINTLNADIKAISDKAMEREIQKARELNDLNTMISTIEGYLNSKCGCLTHMLAYKNLPNEQTCNCRTQLKDTTSGILKNKDLVLAMFLKKRTELVYNLCTSGKKAARPESEYKRKLSPSISLMKSAIKDNMNKSSHMNDKENDKKSIFYKHNTASDKKSKSNSSYLISKSDQALHDLTSSAINLGVKHKKMAKKKPNGKTQSADHENAVKNDNAEIYKKKKKLDNNRPLTTNFLNDENPKTKKAANPKKRESFLTAMITKNISDISFFNNMINSISSNNFKHTKTSNTFKANAPDTVEPTLQPENNSITLKVPPSQSNVIPIYPKEQTDLGPNSKEDNKISTAFMKRAITGKYSSNTGSVKSKFYQDHNASSFNKAKTSKFIKKSMDQSPNLQIDQFNNVIERKPTFSNSNESSEKFVVGNEFLKNQWLHAKSIQSFTSRFMKEQSVDIRNDDDNKTVFTNFVPE